MGVCYGAIFKRFRKMQVEIDELKQFLKNKDKKKSKKT
jgi:hypothetical protein